MPRTNQQRIIHAAIALDRYDALSDSAESRCDDELLIDLFTDLRHWAKAEGVDLDRAIRISEMHFDSEKGGD